MKHSTERMAHIFVEVHPYKVVIQPRTIQNTLNIQFFYSVEKYRTRANIDKIKVDKTATSFKAKNDCIKALTIVFKP